MENNNDNNLFSNMFGMESEETPIQQPPVEEPPVQEQSKVEEPPVVQTPIQPSTPTPPPVQVQEEIIVLDSNPKPIEEPKPVPEQPISLNTINSNINTMPKEDNYDFNDNTSKDSSYKTVCIILGVTLLIVLAAFPLYSVVNNYLNSTKENQTIEDKQTIPQEDKNEEKEEKPKVELNINFDLDVTFDKGYTTNPNELNQIKGYQPEDSEGVIKCETINNIQSQTEIAKAEYYFYYKDYMTKKFLAIQKYKFVNLSTYNSNLQALQSLRSVMTQNEHMYTKLLTDTNSYRLDFYMLQDLAYSQAIKVPDSDYYFDSTISYNKPIKSAMNQFLGDQAYVGNMYCSTINTQDASI